MCGRFSLYEIQEFLNDYNIHIDQPIKPRYNIAPSQNAIIIPEPDHTIYARWGLIPHWSKEIATGYSMINAKAETLLEKSAYKMPFLRQRCLVPADGFYEWKKKGSEKIPFRVMLKDRKVFSFAGIYDRWKDKEGKEIISFSIITVAPNDIVKPIHDRMPAILKKEHERLWLDDTGADKLMEIIIKPYPGTETKAYEISRLVNSPLADSPEILKSVNPPKVRSLEDY